MTRPLSVSVRTGPDWTAHSIWWQVYPLGFLGAEPVALPHGSAGTPRLRRLIPWLDYLVELGGNGLLLNPIFESETHGYDTIDHFRIDRRLGSDRDLELLVAACADRGVRIVLDGVFNHVGRTFPRYADVVAHGTRSRYRDWFRIDWDSRSPNGFRHHPFEGHQSLVTLNHDNPEVADHVGTVMNHWLDRGIDGWRLDAAYAVPQHFWRRVLPRVRERHPQAWFVGEVIHGHYPDWAGPDGLDAVTQYELWKSIWSSLNDGNFFELSWTLNRHNDFGADVTTMTFVGNHDVTRIASRLDDHRHLGHALAILLTLPGIPCVYSGDERGLTGIKQDRAGGDDAIRPAFPALPQDVRGQGDEIFRLHQQLIGLRRRFPWVVAGRTDVVHLANRQLAYDVLGPDGRRLRVLLNLDDHDHHFPVDPGVPTLLTHDGVDRGANVAAAHGWTIAHPPN